LLAVLPSSIIAAMPFAFAAGLISFVSPCVLPLLPGYLAFLGGATGTVNKSSGRGRAVVGSLAFIFGFAVVFVSLGALFGQLGVQLRIHQRAFEVVFGVVTVLLGMFFAGWWPSNLLLESIAARTEDSLSSTSHCCWCSTSRFYLRSRMDAMHWTNTWSNPRSSCVIKWCHSI